MRKDISCEWLRGLLSGVFAAATGFSLVVYFSGCGSEVVTLKGAKGDPGIQGVPGNDGVDGTDAMSVTVVKLCPGAPSYPSTFIEYAFCIQGNLYATYSANGGFTTYLPPGIYNSVAVNSSCTFTVGDNCQITY